MLAELLTFERSEPVRRLLSSCSNLPYSWAPGQPQPDALTDYMLNRISAAVEQGGFAKTYSLGGRLAGLCVASPDDWAARELNGRTYRINYLMATGRPDIQLFVKQMLVRETLREMAADACLVAQVPYTDLTGINALERCGFAATQTSMKMSRELTNHESTAPEAGSYSVEPARPSDVDGLEDDVLQVPDGLLGWDSYLPLAARSRIHRDWLRSYARDSSLLLAYDHGRPVGLLAEHVRDETSRYLGFSVGTIDLVATVPEYRNNGVATTLVSSTLDLFRNRGARVAELTVHSTDTPSAHVYQSQGFVTVGSALTLTNWRR